MSLNDAKNAVGQVAEGIRTLEVVKQESDRLKIKMPLVDSLFNIIYKNEDVSSLISDLVKNPSEIDVEFTYKE